MLHRLPAEVAVLPKAGSSVLVRPARYKYVWLTRALRMGWGDGSA